MPNKDTRRASKIHMKWMADQLAKGLCRSCHRPRAVVNGKMQTRCEVHRVRRFKRNLHNYKPPVDLFPLTAFSSCAVADLAYAAGLIEGEGCIIFTDKPGSPRTGVAVKVGMVDRRPVEFLHKLFGGTLVRRIFKNPLHHPQYHWTAFGRRAGAVAAAIARYLKSYRRRNAALLAVRITSVTGWWVTSSYDAIGPDVMALFARLKEGVATWRLQSSELALKS